MRIFLLPASGVRSVVCTPPSQPVPDVLQPVLPSGLAAGDRAGTAVATARSSRTTATAAGPLPRALSSLIGIGHDHTPAYVSFAPQKKEEMGGSRNRSGPPCLSPILHPGDRAMNPYPVGQVCPVPLDQLGDRFRHDRLRVPQAVT